MRLRTYLPVAVAILLAAGLSLATAIAAVDRIERTARVELVKILNDGGFGWARPRVDGLQVFLLGTAPDEAARFGAISAAGQVVDASRVIDRIEVETPEGVAAPEFKLEILRNLDGISVIGLIPAGEGRAAILDRLGRMSDEPVTDLMESGDYPVPGGWEPAVEFALGALEALPRSKVSVTATEVAVTGIVDSEEDKLEIENALATAAPGAVDLTVDIAAPRPVIAPFTVRAVLEDGALRFDACAVETDADRRTIAAAAREVGLAGEVGCAIGLGAPSVDWARAVAQGLTALGDIGAGDITFSDADVTLIAPHTVAQSDFDGVVGRLERDLPLGFSLTAQRREPPQEEVEDDTGKSDAQRFVATLGEDGVHLTGRLPRERAQAAVEAYAHAHFGVAATDASTRLDDSLPPNWTLRVLTALDALSILSSGEVVLTGETASITGQTGSADGPAEIARLFSERFGRGADYQIDVTYVETLDETLDLPSPEECVAQVNTVLSVQQITFEPGSATVDQGGLQIIDQIADILRDCTTVEMVIEGHTDSQGRESMNLNLSQERADAVLNAIMARRVLTSNLTAKGYGEERPIADNDTEEGREANRRIAFRLAEPEAEEDATDAGEDSEEAAAE